MSNYLPPSIRVAQQLTEAAVLHGSHSSVVLLAVKCLKRPRSEEQRNRMARRLAKLEELRHPHVVRYYLNSLGSDSEDISIVMEAWGVSVASLVARKQHCGKEFVASFAVQVLQALVALHAVGVVHGDIKPANILLSGAVYKVCDIDEAATGSACYMSPSRARRHPVLSARDTYSDTYALGMSVLEVLTGRQPYCELDTQCLVFTRVCAGVLPRSWSACSRLAYDGNSACLIAALLDTDSREQAACDAGATPRALLALVRLLWGTEKFCEHDVA
jgi:serine/threonine protein kinase